MECKISIDMVGSLREIVPDWTIALFDHIAPNAEWSIVLFGHSGLRSPSNSAKGKLSHFSYRRRRGRRGVILHESEGAEANERRKTKKSCLCSSYRTGNRALQCAWPARSSCGQDCRHSHSRHPKTVLTPNSPLAPNLRQEHKCAVAANYENNARPSSRSHAAAAS